MPSNLLIANKMRGQVVVGNTTMSVATAMTTKVKDEFCNMGVLPEGARSLDTPAPVEILSAIGCSIDTSTDKTFSLLTEQTDQEVIQNPNIFDNIKWEELKNENILALDKFPNVNDNFFKADYPISITAQNEWLNKGAQEQNRKNPTKMVEDLIELNLATSYKKTLPQFK